MVIAFITLLNVTRYTFIFGEYKQQKQLSLKYGGTTPIREPNLRYLHIENSFSFFSWKIISVLVPFPSVRTGAKPVSFLGQAPLWRVSWQSKHDKLIYKKRKYDLVVNRTLTKSGQLLAVIFCSRFPSAVSFQEQQPVLTRPLEKLRVRTTTRFMPSSPRKTREIVILSTGPVYWLQLT